MWLTAPSCCPARDHVLHANGTLVDRVDLATPLSLSSQPATGLSVLAPAQRAGAQRLCALALRDILHRQMTSVATGGIAEVDGQPSIVEGDARDPERTWRLRFERSSPNWDLL